MAIRKNKKATTGSVMGAVSGLFGDQNNRRNMAGSIAMKKAAIKNNAFNGALAGAMGGAVGGALNYGNSGGNSGGGGYTRVEMPVDVGALPTFNSSYLDQLNALARQLTSMNYEDWTKGSQYQALAERYGASGRMSMQDVLGQVASRTGGLASSYATTAAQQQYNQYMAQLEEVARQLYSQERGDLMDSASLYRNLANDEYDRYRDSLSDYNARLKAAQSAARSVYGGTSYNSGNNYSFVSATRPKIGRESASETGSTSFSNIKRTISGKLAGGDVEGASRLVESVWDDLSNKQKQDIKKMGFSVS